MPRPVRLKSGRYASRAPRRENRVPDEERLLNSEERLKAYLKDQYYELESLQSRNMPKLYGEKIRRLKNNISKVERKLQQIARAKLSLDTYESGALLGTKEVRPRTFYKGWRGAGPV